MENEKKEKMVGFFISAETKTALDEYCKENALKKGRLAEIAIKQFLASKAEKTDKQ